MAKSLTSLAVNITANTAKLQAGLTGAQKLVNKFNTKITVGSAKLAAFGAAATAFAAAMTATYVVMRNVSKQFDELDKIGKTSTKIGIAADQLVALRFAGEKAGIAATSMDTALQRMTRRLADAERAGGPLADRLEALGLNISEMVNNSPDENLQLLADVFKNITNQAQRTSLAMALFDTEGVAMVNLLQNGSAAMQEQIGRAYDLNVALRNAFDVKAIEAANDAIADIKFAYEGVWQLLAIKIAPYVEQIALDIADWIIAFNGENGDGFNQQIEQAINWLADFSSQIHMLIDTISLTYNSLKWLGEIMLMPFVALYDVVVGLLSLIVDVPENGLQPFTATQGLFDEMNKTAENIAKVLDSNYDGTANYIQDVHSRAKNAMNERLAAEQAAADLERQRRAFLGDAYDSSFPSNMSAKDIAKQAEEAEKMENRRLEAIESIFESQQKQWDELILSEEQQLVKQLELLGASYKDIRLAVDNFKQIVKEQERQEREKKALEDEKKYARELEANREKELRSLESMIQALPNNVGANTFGSEGAYASVFGRTNDTERLQRSQLLEQEISNRHLSDIRDFITNKGIYLSEAALDSIK